MEELTHQGVDSRAMLATYIMKLPLLFMLAVTGAVAGGGLSLLIALIDAREPVYVSETEYYISFAEGRYEARDYYNAFTWNDVIATDEILGRVMELISDDYDRSQVKEMITADILSDVRYLTVTVRGNEPSDVETVKTAIGQALEEFGLKKEGFKSIKKIEDLPIVQEKKRYFAWRAAFIGTVIFTGAGIFVIALNMSMGSVFYTKNDIIKILGVPACGLVFADRNNKKTDDILTERQHEILVDNLRLLFSKYSKIALLDAFGGKYAEGFREYLKNSSLSGDSELTLYSTERALTDDKIAIIAVIPFGKQYREKITDEINHAIMHDGKLVAAVLVQADRRWMKIYYAYGRK